MFVSEGVPELKGLVEELDALADLDLDARADTEITALLVGLRQQRARLSAVIARVGAAFVHRRAWAADGSRTAAAHLAAQAGEPPRGARADVRSWTALADLPATSAALAAGRITEAHARRLVGAARGERRAAFLDGEAMLVGFAHTLDGWEFDHALRVWELAADDALSIHDPTAVDRDRWAEITTDDDDRTRIDAQLARVPGAEFRRAAALIERDLFRADWADAKARLGRKPALAELTRTPAQRRADVLPEMARRALAAPPGARAPEPLVSVLVSPTVLDRMCQLADGTPITPYEALEATLRGRIRRAVWETPLRVQVSPAQRVFTGATRDGVKLRDQFCTWRSPPGPDGRPGQRCRVPADDCEVDHTVRYEDGGPTTQENGQLLCVDHHPGRRTDQPWLGPPIEPGHDSHPDDHEPGHDPHPDDHEPGPHDHDHGHDHDDRPPDAHDTDHHEPGDEPP